MLLTAYADTDVAIKAINDIGLDYYLLKPWDPPEERLYPVLDDLLATGGTRTSTTPSGVRVVGHRWSERSHEIKTFLARNHVPYRWLDLERDDEAHRLHELAGATAADLPLVLVPDGEPLRAPSTARPRRRARPAHDARSSRCTTCASSAAGRPVSRPRCTARRRGLQTVVVEREAPGGQAGQSAAIENYLGFPKGLSGADLTHRAVAQARRFGAEMVLARDVVGFEARGPVHAVCFGDGTEIEARTVLVATGVSYRLLDAPGLEELTGRGVYYGATASEARACEGDDVYIVGAANSAGQAALNLARFARRVVLLVRVGLAREVDVAVPRRAHPRRREHRGAAPDRGRRRGAATTTSRRSRSPTARPGPRRRCRRTGCSSSSARRRAPTGSATDVARDERGLRGHRPGPRRTRTSGAALAARRGAPFALETSVPGVFAAGDVRLDSMKRVASAVGEGAMSVYLVHRYLATI